jgi:Mg2+ and Co2+ transporter CorA
MGRKKKGDLTSVSFTIQKHNNEKLNDLAHAEGISKSEFIDKLIDSYKIICFDVEQRKTEIETAIKAENQAHSTRIKELEEKRLELSRIGKQKRILDRVMVSKKEEYIQKIVSALDRDSSYDGIDSIAREGQRVSGVDALQLINEAITRRKDGGD